MVVLAVAVVAVAVVATAETFVVVIDVVPDFSILVGVGGLAPPFKCSFFDVTGFGCDEEGRIFFPAFLFCC